VGAPCAQITILKEKGREEGGREEKQKYDHCSYIERQRRVLGLKRPEGVSIRIEGGLRGYSGGNLSLPW